MNKTSKKIKLLSLTFVMLFLSAEVFARFVLGLGSPVLYETSPIYGYRPIPNQNIRRFGKRIFYNAQALRSEPASINPVPGTIRVLCIGDSITYGGTQTDQLETYPYQLQKLLNREKSVVFEVLNASAGGWAIENEEAYLRQEGIYGSKIVILELGSHDLFQPKSSGKIVGRLVSFPKDKPLFALAEGFFRYFIPNFFPSLQLSEPNLQGDVTKKDIDRNIASFVRIAKFVKARKAQLILLIVEQPNGLEPNNFLATLSKELLVDKARELNVPYNNLREEFRIAGGSHLFRDGLHPNPAGNMVMAKASAQLIQNSLNKKRQKV